MNRNNNTTFCKVCQDAGKPESVYRSHNVRAANAVITCPTLKSIECRYCLQKGHTIKYCSTLKNKDKKQVATSTPSTTTNKAIAEPKKQVIKNANLFSALSDDEEEEVEEEDYSIILPKPVLKRETRTILTGYAAMAAKPMPIVEKSPIIPLAPVTEKEVVTTTRPANTIFKRSWADDWTSDEEDI